ncbi:nuclear transport factor 2 family protein [Aequorivita sp. SDUM287046]|uniref:Nuclear transport factor 2 family protein n=1 Tax=Aequorivita aurantiaca TaxID=3053356 RepID=A0ABT8DIX6_9FLAO|nr:nuclear transport factor 2 family protein [Aequorivita aurantiaca]MDN3724872.1 nuclear transport factor 2 family protein [Aequorivita aurantiaca]
MKTLKINLFLFAFAIFGSAYSQEINTDQNISIVDGLYKSFAAGDIPSVLGAMDANIVWNESSCSSYADGNPYKNPEAVLNGVFKRIGEDSENFKLENIQLVEMGDNKVLASLNYNFIAKKTGEKILTSVIHEWTIDNGKITAFQQYLGLGKQ